MPADASGCQHALIDEPGDTAEPKPEQNESPDFVVLPAKPRIKVVIDEVVRDQGRKIDDKPERVTSERRKSASDSSPKSFHLCNFSLSHWS